MSEAPVEHTYVSAPAAVRGETQEQANARSAGCLRCHTASDAPTMHKSDAVVFSDVVGHLDDIERAFERVRPLLAPAGRVIVTYYNFVWEPVLKLAERIATTSVDLHELEHLIGRGCPRGTAYRILRP